MEREQKGTEKDKEKEKERTRRDVGNRRSWRGRSQQSST
jgi:hypothetical protein